MYFEICNCISVLNCLFEISSSNFHMYKILLQNEIYFLSYI